MRTVVVVDDDPDVSEILASVLEAEGYRALLAPDGQSGLALIREERPDLVLTDVMMPVLDGMEMARIIHHDPALRHIPVVLMSAGVKREADKTEVYDSYLKKPFTLRDVLRIVEEHIGKRGSGKL